MTQAVVIDEVLPKRKSLRVLDVTVIRIFAKKGSLAVNRRAISDIALAEDARGGLS